MTRARDSVTGRRRSPGDERGFTLPELTIVIAIMGILAAIAVPMWWGIVDSRQVDSAANQIVADLRLAHSKSTNRLEDWVVAKNPFTILGMTTPPVSSVSCQGNPPDYYVVQVRNPINTSVTTAGCLPEGTDVTGFGARFKSDGSTRTVNDNTITPPIVSLTVHKENNPATSNPKHDIELAPATSKVSIVD